MSRKLVANGKPVKEITWVKDAALTYEASAEGNSSMIETHEYDAVLHVFVVFKDETTEEWVDNGVNGSPPGWMLDLIDQATRT